MTDLYTQTIENPLDKTARRKQVGSAVAFVVGICSVGLAIGVSYYFFILTGSLILLGALLTISFNKTVKSFEYGCNQSRLIFSVTTVISRTERNIEILLDDVAEYGDFQDLTIESDFIMCPNVNEDGVKAMIFKVGNNTARVLFKPDGYLNAFLKESLPREVTEKNIIVGEIC